MPDRTKTLLLPLLGVGLVAAIVGGWKLFVTKPAARTPKITYLSPADHSTNRTAPGDIVLPKVAGELSRGAGALEKIDWVGPNACTECHQEKFDSFKLTNHYHTSAPGVPAAVKGSFKQGENTLTTGVSELDFKLEQMDEELFQIARWLQKEIHRERIDVVFGSGKIGQTFGFWKGDVLLELPVSHYSASNSWINSPGYRDGTAIFTRPITVQCLNCHATAFVPKIPEPKAFQYHSREMIYGVTCEKCHGSGRRHVDYHRAHPGAKQPHHILHPGDLSKTRLNQLCSRCHGGLGGAAASKPGVHSNNQWQRLRKSRCHTASGGLSCLDCHDPHHRESGQADLFARRCQKCHEPDDCGAVTPANHASLTRRCAECHMEQIALDDIPIETATGRTRPKMSDHFIRVPRPTTK